MASLSDADGGAAVSAAESESNDDAGVKVDGDRGKKTDLASLFDAVDSEVRA